MPIEVPSPRPSHRLWIPATILALVVGGIIVTRLQPELERNLKNWITAGILQLGLLLVLVWFLFMSRLRWRLRLFTLLVLGLAAFGFKQVIRVDGTSDGTGLPRLAWRWTPQRTLALPTPAAAPPAATPAVQDSPDVPQFFGPNRTGVVRDAKLNPDWSTHPPRELWRQPVGSGWSAFAVVDGRAFTQEQRGESELVVCYDVRTGKLIWSHADKARFYQWQGGEGPRATPTVVGGRVYSIGGTGLLNCLNASDGQVIWSKDVLAGQENLTWGVSASPLVFNDTVVVVGAAKGNPTLLAYQANDGASLWQAGTDKASYASPILATLLGRPWVLSVNAGTFTAHDPKTGGIALNHPWAGGNQFPKAAQPVVIGDDRVFLSAGYGMGCMLLKIEAASGGQLKATELWKSLKMKTQFNSVAEREGFLYGIDDGRLACLEIASGERRWKEGRFGSGQSLLADDLILVQAESGDVVLARAQPDQYLELGRIAALSSKTWNHPVLAGRYLLVRNDREAVCYEVALEGISTR